jgi:type IV pilus assembly protein PilE
VKRPVGRKSNSGFTLLEILIVLIIIGALAALAIPAYTTTVEKSRKQEAFQALSALRESQLRYRMGNATYSATYTALDFNPTDVASDPPGMVRHFTYAAPTAAAATWSAVATRNATDRPAGVPAYTVTIDQTGTITSTY